MHEGFGITPQNSLRRRHRAVALLWNFADDRVGATVAGKGIATGRLVIVKRRRPDFSPSEP
jgi:hypothetical protein